MVHKPDVLMACIYSMYLLWCTEYYFDLPHININACISKMCRKENCQNRKTGHILSIQRITFFE